MRSIEAEAAADFGSLWTWNSEICEPVYHRYFCSIGLRVAGQSAADPFSLYQISPLWSLHNACLPVVPGSTGAAVIV
jgi:hypothetical protein